MENYEFTLYQEHYPVTSLIIPIIEKNKIPLESISLTQYYKRLEFVNNTDPVVFEQSEVCNLFNISEDIIRIQFLRLYKAYSIHTKNYEIWITKLID
jgi:hypothetical protein